MKLSEFKGEDALNVLATIIKPVTEILNDKEIKAAWSKGADIAKCVEIAIKKHQKAVVIILSTMAEKSYEEYMKDATVFSITGQFVEMLNDQELINFLLPPLETKTE